MKPNFCGMTAEDNEKIEQYFNTLPVYVQETILQSAVSIHSVEELQSCAKNMTECQ